MDTIKFGDLPTAYPLIYDPGFTITRPELYDPETGAKSEAPGPTQYSASFLVPVLDYPTIKEALRVAKDSFTTTNEITTIAVTVASDNVAVESGTFDVFWVTDTYERYTDQVLVTLMGYGEPEQTTIAPNQTFTVVEGAANGTVVGTVKGFKPGLSLESRPDIPFTYQPTSGVLSVSGKVDYEEATEWVLTIGGQEVTIWVLDAPENPLPTQTTYTYYLDPNTAPGTVIGTVAATQQGVSGVLPSYSLVSGNTGGWAIDTVTGEITYLGGQPLVDGQVLGVGYGGTDPLTVTLRVLPPTVITLPILRFTLPSTLTDGQLVGDVGDTGIVASLTHPGFGVVGNKLVVADKSQIEPGLTELTLELTGDGRTGTQSVFVVVADHPKVNEFWIAEDSENGASVGTVELAGGGTYALTPTTLFNINSGTGDVIVTNSSLLTPGSYPLTVTKGTESTTATVKVYAILTTGGLEFTVAPSTTSGTVVGTVSGAGPFSVSSTIAPYTLNTTTGEITLSTTPPTALTFTVTDSAGDTTDVAISLEAPTAVDNGFIGAVYPGQTGQAVVAKAGVLFSIGNVGFGQGSLNVDPDNLGSVSRNTEGRLVASKAPGLQLTISGTANAAMMVALKALWAQTLETPHTVSVMGEDWVTYMVNFKRGYSADGATVSIELRTSLPSDT